jgi:catechol 2,3-dioxygenase-like lactoylglutathione lyase family enzyme
MRRLVLLRAAAAAAALALGGCVAPFEERSMEPRLYRVILPVTDIERAARFYGEVLGAPGRRVSGGRHYFDCGGTILACFDPRADGDGYDAAPNPEWLYFAVDDLEATLAACVKAGATPSKGDVHGELAGAIAKRPWGERSFYAEDPFGNKVCFVDRTTVFTGR